MDCKEQQRLSEAYFDAFKRQQWITQRLDEIRRMGDQTMIKVAEAQEQAALDEVYDAWQALNQHTCSGDCVPPDR